MTEVQKQVFYKKGLLKNFAKFAEKQQRRSFFFNKVAGLEGFCKKAVLKDFANFTRNSCEIHDSAGASF